MIDEREVFEKSFRRYEPEGGSFERLVRRRDRKRRNQRITAGVVGIAVFVAAVWVVTTAGSFDQSQTPAVPGGAETGPAETGPTQTALPPARASAAPDAVRQGTCSAGARSHLELTDMGSQIKLRFEVHRSPVGHIWRIKVRQQPDPISPPVVVFQRTRVARGDSGDLALTHRFPDAPGSNAFMVGAIDTQTGQVCRVDASI